MIPKSPPMELIVMSSLKWLGYSLAFIAGVLIELLYGDKD